MIQRIQSVFLALLALCMVALAALPLWHKTDGLTHQQLTLTAWQLQPGQLALPPNFGPVYLIGACALAAAVLALVEIFQFRNRLRQLQLGMVNLLLLAGTFGLAFYFSSMGEKYLNPKLEGEFLPAFYLPTLAMLLNLLANRFIRRDEQLVRSADRLR